MRTWRTATRRSTAGSAGSMGPARSSYSRRAASTAVWRRPPHAGGLDRAPRRRSRRGAALSRRRGAHRLRLLVVRWVRALAGHGVRVAVHPGAGWTPFHLSLLSRGVLRLSRRDLGRGGPG